MEFVVARVNSRKVKIPLGLCRPVIKDFTVFENWLKRERDFAVSLKRRLESGKKLRHSVRNEMIRWSKKTEEKFRKLSLLKNEETLLSLDMKIKTSLVVGNPNLKECKNHLKELKDLELTPLMLKKNPIVVKTIQRLMSFVGDTSDVIEGQKLEIIRETEEMKKLASSNIRKFRELFKVPEDQSFFEYYEAQLKIFKKKTSNMTISQVSSMTEEPKERSKKKEKTKSNRKKST